MRRKLIFISNNNFHNLSPNDPNDELKFSFVLTCANTKHFSLTIRTNTEIIWNFHLESYRNVSYFIMHPISKFITYILSHHAYYKLKQLHFDFCVKGQDLLIVKFFPIWIEQERAFFALDLKYFAEQHCPVIRNVFGIKWHKIQGPLL